MKNDRTLSRCLLLIGIACALCFLILIASRIQNDRHEELIAQCDEFIYSGGRR